MPFQNNQNCAANHPHFITICVLRYQSDRQHVGIFFRLFVFHIAAEQEAIKLILFFFHHWETPVAPLALDYVNAKTKVYNFLLFFFLNFLKILYLMYIMNIYKYIYNDDTVIHNNYKMINDKKQNNINTRGENYIKSNKLFFRVVFYLLLLCEVGLDPLPSRWLL